MRNWYVPALEIWARHDHAWPDESSLRDLRAPRRERIPIAGHVADARDAVRDVQREQRTSARDRRVHMHVPKPRDEKFSSATQHTRARRNTHRCRRTDAFDAIAAHDHGLIRTNC